MHHKYVHFWQQQKCTYVQNPALFRQYVKCSSCDKFDGFTLINDHKGSQNVEIINWVIMSILMKSDFGFQ